MTIRWLIVKVLNERTKKIFWLAKRYIDLKKDVTELSDYEKKLYIERIEELKRIKKEG